MNSENNVVVSYTTDADRATFFKKTYSHVAYAILAFMLVESILILEKYLKFKNVELCESISASQW